MPSVANTGSCKIEISVVTPRLAVHVVIPLLSLVLLLFVFLFFGLAWQFLGLASGSVPRDHFWHNWEIVVPGTRPMKGKRLTHYIIPPALMFLECCARDPHARRMLYHRVTP